MKRRRKFFVTNRCVNPKCKTPDKEFNWDFKPLKISPITFISKCMFVFAKDALTILFF
jgi:hypothetical protein